MENIKEILDRDIIISYNNMYNSLMEGHISSILKMGNIKDILGEMIDFFSSPGREEYEKCNRIKEILKKIG